MKKILFSMMAIAGLFASCQANLEPVVVDEVATVSFEVSTPEIATRAYSDGTTATLLQYAVYSVNGNTLTQIEELTVVDAQINKSTTVDLQLTTGNTYAMIFWASEASAPYTVDFASKTMTANYNGVLSNNENLDAFYKYVEPFTVNGAMSKTVELKRPFAQLNIGTNDFVAAAATGYVPATSAVTVKNVFSTLDFTTGVASDEIEVAFAANTIPAGETFPVTGYEYLAMNYLLVNTDKEVVDIEFTYADANNDARTRTVGSVPVQRNHRTNIYGQILTSNVDINVEIKPGFDKEDNNVEDWDGATITEPEYDETTSTYTLVKASDLAYLAALVNGTLDTDMVTRSAVPANSLKGCTVKLEADIYLNGQQWMPIGKENYFEGVFDGNGYTIYDLKYYSEGEDYFVGLFGLLKDATVKNLTITNVDIKLTGDETWGHIGAVAGWAEGTSSFENITVNGDVMIEGEMTQNGSQRIGGVVGGNLSGNLTFSNVNVNASAGSYVKGYMQVGGLAGQLQGKASFVDCSSNIDVYAQQAFAGGIIGLAAGENPLTNCHTTGNMSVVAGRAGNVNDIHRVGGIAGGWADNLNTPLVLTGCSYTGVLFAQDANGVQPEEFDYLGYVGRGYTLANMAGSKVVIDGDEFVQAGNEAPYGKYIVNGFAQVSTADEFVASLSAGYNILLTSDITMSKVDLTSLSNDVVIDLNNNSITTSSYYGVEVVAGNNVTLKNGEIVITKNGDYINYAAGFKISNGNYEGQTITLENCVIRMANADFAYAITMPASVQNLNLVIDNSVLEGAIALQCWGDNNTITVTGGELICNYTTSELYTSACLAMQDNGSYSADNNILSVSNTKFSYSGVDNYNSNIYSVKDYAGEKSTNTITVSNCTYVGVEAY